MTHLGEDQLIATYYGAAADPHLEVCEECAAELRRITALLDEVRAEAAPEPPAGLADRVWARVEPETRVVLIPRRRPSRAWIPWAAAAAVLAGVSFQAGRYSTKPEPTPVVTAQQRADWVALGRHLERTRILLAEVANGTPSEGDAAARATLARDLLGANRRFREATDQGPAGLLLEDLDAVLSRLAGGDVRLRDEIDGQELLFRLHLLESQLRGPKPAALEHKL